MNSPRRSGIIAVWLLASATLFAARLPIELYNLDFINPEVGTYGISGSVSAQAAVGPFVNALLFQGTSSGGRIDLPVNVASPHYNIQYDMLVHAVSSSQYAFTMYLDAGAPRSVSLHGGLNYIYVFQSDPYTLANAGGYVNDRVYHFEADIDMAHRTWWLAVDGTQRFSSTIDGFALNSLSIQFGPWVGGAADSPRSYAALDNVLITVPEPAVVSLFGLGMLAAARLRTRGIRRQRSGCRG